MILGAVWMIRLPILSGREQGGERPGIIVQDEVIGQNSPLMLVVPLTSSLGALRFPATKIEQTAENNHSTALVAMVFQVRALDRSRFIRRLGTVSADDLNAILFERDSLTGQ